MSAFEVTITPPSRMRNRLSEALQPTIVCMAPFSAKSIVQFEDVPLTKTARRILRVVNPSDEDIEVNVTKAIPLEHNVTINWTENFIPAQSEVEMEMIWIPQTDVACKETLQLTDNRNFCKDIMIILKSRCNKPVKTRKFPTISTTSNSTAHVRTTMRLKSPTNGIKQKRTFINTQLQQRKKEKKKTETTVRTSATTTTIKNLSKANNVTGKPQIIFANTSHINPLVESNTMMRTTQKFVQNNFNISPLLRNSNDIPKENISPLTPDNIMNLIDNLNFTPATTTIGHDKRLNIDNLASLPTPINTTTTPMNMMDIRNSTINIRQLRPRKLTVNELCDSPIESTTELDGRNGIEIHIDATDATMNLANNSGIVANKTFEVKRIEDFNISHDSLDASGIGPTMNRTTTIMCTPLGRTLTMIKEEEDSTSISEATDSTTNKETQNHDHNLKRDIKLVGTPLRKYSESMKDLSWKSLQNKLPIQGSMPNLNEMETIRSIEQNRYFYQSGGIQHCREQSNIISPQTNLIYSKNTFSNLKEPQEEDINCSSVSITSQVDFNFNQSEILAQSSRFNLNELGMRKTKARDSPKDAVGKKPTKNQNVVSSKTVDIKKISPNDTKGEKSKALATHPGHKRSLHELSFSDTQSTDSLTQNDTESLRVSGKHYPPISPPKRQRFDTSYDFAFARPASVYSPKSRNDWSRIQPKKMAKLAKTLSVVKKPITPRKMTLEPRIRLYDTELFLQTSINPDPFAATTTCDPFLASTMYLDERAVEMHQIDFRKWLNALVTMPEDLDADTDTKIDVGKLFNEVRNKDLTLAPTKEEQSMNYLTKYRLESLRRAAVELFISEEMRGPCSKVAVYINKKAFRIRNDRNLHLDIVMQRNILELLLCFNPLWLRLGLEVVYGEKIHLHSNRDIVGLSTFILNRLFRDKFLEHKYSKAYTLSEEYAEHIKKFTLQKTLFLLIFLDKAKSKRIIKHNPCLFVKKSPHKETKDILLRFSSELLADVGSISRDLRRLGYVLQHKQNYLDEFDYAFNNLAVDLRDGVRLTRVMEIILLRDDMTQQLRVPAISRLQRIFNVNLALRALGEADFQLSGNITAADIVDGHREKTLSVLWQIIYKFRSPKFHAAAKTIQTWWWCNWLRVVIRRRIKEKELQRKNIAATKIQAVFRGFLSRRSVRLFKEERIQAAIVVQKHIRRYLVQKRLQKENLAAEVIQRLYRAYSVGKQYRRYFVRLRTSVVFIQRIFRRRLLARMLLLLADEGKRQREQKRHAAAACIQSYWRVFCETRTLRIQYLTIRHYTICMQQRFRAQRQMKQQSFEYMKLRQTTIFVQQKFRAKQLMRIERQSYRQKREIVLKLQQRRRDLLKMRIERAAYVQLRQQIIVIQRRFRATLSMKEQRKLYLRQKSSACVIQRAYRAHVAMKKQLECYQQIRAAVIKIQLKWRATLLARCICVGFITIKYYTIVLQQKFRARNLMRIERAHYLKLRAAAVVVQHRYRANRLMNKKRTEFQAKLQSVLTVQRHWRAYKQMRFERAKYQGIRAAVLCLQQHCRSYLLMNQQRNDYLQLKNVTKCIQRRWRAKLLARKAQQNFQMQRLSTLIIQRRYRAMKIMRSQRKNYIQIRESVIRIQRFYRFFKQMQLERTNFLQKRLAAVRIQRWYGSTKLMLETKRNYERLRTSTLIIQRKWRGILEARQQRLRYLDIRAKIQFIQIKFRCIVKMRKVRQVFIRERNAAIVLQRHYRARLEMLKIRSQYQLIVSLTVCIQRKFRARREMLKTREEYQKLRHYAIHLQQKFRGSRLLKKERSNFLLLRKSIVDFQAHAHGVLARRRFQALMTPEMKELQRRKRAAKIIQRFYRGYRVRKRWQCTAILKIRQNIRLHRTTATTINTLRYKLWDSVRILRGRFNVAEVLNVLLRLERLSRLVPHLIVSHSEFISTFCYGIMAQAIRSEIDKQMIELCSRIILNLARYKSIDCFAFQENGLVTIAQMLLRWCDKDCEIFNTLCTLVWIFAHCPQKCEIIRNFMTTPEAIYMLRETKKLVVRKEKMKLNDRRLLSIGPQQKMFSIKMLPSLEPDYGIINHKPYTFISSVFAFDTLLRKLIIDIF